MMKIRFAAILAAAVLAIGLTGCDPNGPVLVDDDGFAAEGNCDATDAVASTIQDGVNASEDGGDVIVCPGTYTGSVVIDRPMTVKGAKAGVDGRTRAVVEANESIITGSSGGAAGKVQVTADNVIIGGFLFQGVDDSDALYTAPSTSGAEIRNNVFRDNVFGLYLHGNGAKLTVVKRNLFADNNAPGAASGNGIYTDQGLTGAEILENSFRNNANAGILFAQQVQNVLIRDNASEDDTSFVNMFGPGTGNITVRNNTANDTNPDDNDVQGSQIRVGDGVNGVIVRNNMLHNAAFAGIAVRDGVANVDVLDNTVDGATYAGIDVNGTTAGAASEIRGNTSNNNVEYGLHFDVLTQGNFVSNNSASDNGVADCFDESAGPNIGNVANYWSNDNVGAASIPGAICHA